MVEIIFTKSRNGRNANSQLVDKDEFDLSIPHQYLRKQPPLLPALSELEVVRHYTRLSKLNFAIDTHFYPLGSCSMKYNPRAAHGLASLPGFLNCHPYTDESQNHGLLACLYELQEMLKVVTGMNGVSLVPMGGAQGEFVGVAMIKAYHEQRNDFERTQIIVPDAAHGTNPASAAMCGFEVIEVPTMASGNVDLVALEKN